MNITGT